MINMKYKNYYLFILFILIIIIYSFEIKYTNINDDYINKINILCPFELTDNYAGKYGLYFNTTNDKIKKSIEKKYFHHCGAWCLFDCTDPRNGWYWNSTFKEWEYFNKLYLICPQDEFHYALDKFLN